MSGAYLCPPVLLSDKLHLSELHSPHAAGTDVPDFSALDEVVQRLHGLLDRYVDVETVDLQEIDVLEVQTLERCVDGVEDGLAGEADVVGVVL